MMLSSAATTTTATSFFMRACPFSDLAGEENGQCCRRSLPDRSRGNGYGLHLQPTVENVYGLHLQPAVKNGRGLYLQPAVEKRQWSLTNIHPAATLTGL